MQTTSSIPVVLVLAGNDPSGGAGLQADIETLASIGCHAAPVVTAITVQDTLSLKAVYPLEPELVLAQAHTILHDLPVAAIKIGVLGSLEILQAVHSLLNQYPKLPVVLDPVLAAGGGGAALSDAAMLEAMKSLLLPQTTLITPNSVEARRLAPEADTLDACAMALLEHECDYVLLTGGHEPTPEVINRLYGNRRCLDSYSWPRLTKQYHGSGCTLAAAAAGLLAHGEEMPAAVHQAQEYTWSALNVAHSLGQGQLIPNRLFWADEDGDPLA